MKREKRSSSTRSEASWKTKMGVEFSGLERTRDFIVAISIAVVFIVVAMVIAFVAFG